MAIWDWLEIARDYLGHCHGDEKTPINATDKSVAKKSLSGDPMLRKTSFKSSEVKRQQKHHMKRYNKYA